MIPFTNIEDHDMLDLTFNSNLQCISLGNDTQTSKMEEHTQKLLNLKELNFGKKLKSFL